jgi:hypothetical protein
LGIEAVLAGFSTVGTLVPPTGPDGRHPSFLASAVAAGNTNGVLPGRVRLAGQQTK